MSQGYSGGAASSGRARRSLCPSAETRFPARCWEAGRGAPGVLQLLGPASPKNHPSTRRERGAKAISGAAGREGCGYFPALQRPWPLEPAARMKLRSVLGTVPGSCSPTQTPKGLKSSGCLGMGLQPRSGAATRAEKTENRDRATQNSHTLPQHAATVRSPTPPSQNVCPEHAHRPQNALPAHTEP